MKGEIGLPGDAKKAIQNADFEFENSIVKVVANRNNPAIELPGMTVGPFTEGKEYEVRFWVALALKKAGIVRIRMDEAIDLTVLNKIHWKERVQTSQKVMSLPEDFYPKLRRFLEELSEQAIKNLEKRNDYEKAKNLSDDITTMRLKKIISLASSGRGDQTGPILQNLTKEEKFVYNCLHKVIIEWKKEILKPQGSDNHD
jgi:hypothetical protein